MQIIRLYHAGLNLMPTHDAARWNARYRADNEHLDGMRTSFERPRPFLVENSPYLPASGLALDAAMGLGGNAGFLIERGLRVAGVDISDLAVRCAKARLPSLQAVIADLTCFSLPPAAFDLIVNFYYLQRDLWPQYIRALKPGGVLIFETLTQEMMTLRPDIEPVYLLAPGELRKAFAELEIIVYREGWVNPHGKHPRAVASLVARKP